MWAGQDKDIGEIYQPGDDVVRRKFMKRSNIVQGDAMVVQRRKLEITDVNLYIYPLRVRSFDPCN